MANERSREELERLLELKNNEIEQLKKHPIVKQKIVPPADYEKIRRQNHQLDRQNKKYRQLLTFGNVSSLSKQIDDFFTSAKLQMTRISSEIERTDYDSRQVAEILSLIEYLDNLKEELYSFILLSEKGKYLSETEYERIRLDMRVVRDIFANKALFLQMNQKRLLELHEILVHFIRVLKQFLETSPGVPEAEPATESTAPQELEVLNQANEAAGKPAEEDREDAAEKLPADTTGSLATEPSPASAEGASEKTAALPETERKDTAAKPKKKSSKKTGKKTGQKKTANPKAIADAEKARTETN